MLQKTRASPAPVHRFVIRRLNVVPVWVDWVVSVEFQISIMSNGKSSRYWSSLVPFWVLEAAKEETCVLNEVVVRISTSNSLK